MDQLELSQYELASFGRRVLAGFFDLILLAGLSLGALVLIYGTQILISPWLYAPDLSYTYIYVSAPVFLISTVLPLLVVLLCWQTKAATPGKLLTGLKIIDLNQKKPSFARLLYRLAAYALVIPTLGGSILQILINGKRQAVHDQLAKTLVVHIKRRGDQQYSNKFRVLKRLMLIAGNIAGIVLVFAISLASLRNLVLIPAGYMPRANLQTNAQISPRARASLSKNKIIERNAFIVLFHPSGLFYDSNGAILTDKFLISYWKSDEGIQIDMASYQEITRIVLISGDRFYDQSVIEIKTDDADIAMTVSQYKGFDKRFYAKLKQMVKNLESPQPRTKPGRKQDIDAKP